MASKGLHGSIGPGGMVGALGEPEPWRQWRQWHRAPWWARVFGYQWRKMYGHPPHAHGFDYQTNKQRAKALLEERYGDQENVACQQGPLSGTQIKERYIHTYGGKVRYIACPTRQGGKGKTL